MMKNSTLIRLAYHNPSLRPEILKMLKQEQSTKTASLPISGNMSMADVQKAWVHEVFTQAANSAGCKIVKVVDYVDRRAHVYEANISVNPWLMTVSFGEGGIYVRVGEGGFMDKYPLTASLSLIAKELAAKILAS